jgi:pyruvate dehydrogenase E1 component alpha subunit
MNERAAGWYRQMLRIRRFEERCAEAYSAGRIRGFLHLYIGEEAIAAGAMPCLGPADAVISTYREHGHALARGLSMRAVMAEMYGKKAGCSRGRGGSMHLFDVERRFFGGNAIVGGHLPLAVGFALADKQLGRRNVTACFFGDGAVAEGSFHESMNLAALWRLPVLFLCENNRYAMGTALDRHQAETRLQRKAAGYRIPGVEVDGMDVEAVAQAVKTAVDSMREEPGPRFLELLTYRFRAHSMFDAELYRTKEEVQEAMKRDPLTLLAAKYGLDAGAFEKEVQAEVEDAVAFAEAAPLEPREELAWRVTMREDAR